MALGKGSGQGRSRAQKSYGCLYNNDLCYRTKGKYFDEFRYAANGQNLIRCACIARAGYDDIIDIKPQIQLALDSFKRVLEVDSILDITRIKKVSGKEKRVFNDYEKWPCYYHFDILAHTMSWKTEDSKKSKIDTQKQRKRPAKSTIAGASTQALPKQPSSNTPFASERD